jgi:hypothetical protein
VLSVPRVLCAGSSPGDVGCAARGNRRPGARAPSYRPGSGAKVRLMRSKHCGMGAGRMRAAQARRCAPGVRADI